MKINDTKVFKHQFWLLRDDSVMLITDIREGEPTYPIMGVRGVYSTNPASELSWQSDGRIAGNTTDSWDMIRRLTDFQMHYKEAA